METGGKRPGAGEAARILKNGRRCEEVIKLFSFLSNRIRFKLLCVLDEGDFCVNELVELVDGKTSNVSQQLKLLSLAGFLEKQRREKSIYYRLKDRKIKRFLRFLYAEFGGEAK